MADFEGKSDGTERELYLETVRGGKICVNPRHLPVEEVRRNEVQPTSRSMVITAGLVQPRFVSCAAYALSIVAASVFCVPRLASLFLHSAVFLFIVLGYFVILCRLGLVIDILKFSGASSGRNHALNNFFPRILATTL